jgi:hypothetical protein
MTELSSRHHVDVHAHWLYFNSPPLIFDAVEGSVRFMRSTGRCVFANVRLPGVSRQSLVQIFPDRTASPGDQGRCVVVTCCRKRRASRPDHSRFYSKSTVRSGGGLCAATQRTIPRPERSDASTMKLMSTRRSTSGTVETVRLLMHLGAAPTLYVRGGKEPLLGAHRGRKSLGST